METTVPGGLKIKKKLFGQFVLSGRGKRSVSASYNKMTYFVAAAYRLQSRLQCSRAPYTDVVSLLSLSTTDQCDKCLCALIAMCENCSVQTLFRRSYKPLLISHPAEGRRLSWSEHTVD